MHSICHECHTFNNVGKPPDHWTQCIKCLDIFRLFQDKRFVLKLFQYLVEVYESIIETQQETIYLRMSTIKVMEDSCDHFVFYSSDPNPLHYHVF